jgi:dTMP kinase
MFIVVEGIEGSGKSTLLSNLARHLSSESYDVKETREPGGTPLGDAVRHIFLRSVIEISGLSECLLFNAARAQHVSTVIRPALQANRIVLCDRFTDSTLAYQGYGRGLDLQLLRSVCDIATAGLRPDLTFLLDLPLHLIRERLNERDDQLAFFQVNLSRARSDRVRIKDRTEDSDRFEKENDNFLERVRGGYLALAQQSARHHVLDATRSAEDLAQEAFSEVRAHISVRIT